MISIEWDCLLVVAKIWPWGSQIIDKKAIHSKRSLSWCKLNNTRGIRESVCLFALMHTYINLHLYAYINIHIYAAYVYIYAVYHVPKCMSCHKAIVVINGRVHSFHDCIYTMPVLLLWDLSTMCTSSYFYIYIYIIYYIYI